jgi:tRNA threonylcarbamoyladenosine biosynthesis protein TsaB
VRILAFDTATPATAVALSAPDGVMFTARHDPRPGERPGHATRLLPLVALVLEGAGLSWDGVDRIAVGVGPGTFTGLRIGIATARALARARGIPLIGVSTLQSLALAGPQADAVRPGLDTVLAVLDARRGEVFAAGWRMDEADDFDSALLAPRAVSPDALADLVEPLGATTLAIGDGAIAFREALERSGSFIPEDNSPLHRVTAVNHCRLAARLEGSVPDEVRPDYLRAPDAEIAHRRPETPRSPEIVHRSQ